MQSLIKGKGTKPELLVRRWLWGHGYRYRLNVKSVPGKPDIVMRPYRTAIFVNGCFWHGHNVKMGGCVNAKIPESVEPQSGNNPNYTQHSKREHIEKELLNSACCKIPTTNRTFWVEKIRRNQERDERNYRLLQENGWQVIVVWECQLKPAARLEHTMREVELLLNDNMISRYKSPRPAPKTFTQPEEETLPLAAEENATY